MQLNSIAVLFAGEAAVKSVFYKKSNKDGAEHIYLIHALRWF